MYLSSVLACMRSRQCHMDDKSVVSTHNGIHAFLNLHHCTRARVPQNEINQVLARNRRKVTQKRQQEQQRYRLRQQHRAKSIKNCLNCLKLFNLIFVWMQKKKQTKKRVTWDCYTHVFIVACIMPWLPTSCFHFALGFLQQIYNARIVVEKQGSSVQIMAERAEVWLKQQAHIIIDAVKRGYIYKFLILFHLQRFSRISF